MLIIEVLFGLWAYSIAAAITRISRLAIATSAFTEGATAFLWPLYWATVGLGWVAFFVYLVLSGEIAVRVASRRSHKEK